MSTAQPAPKVDLILQVKVFFDPKDRETFLAAFKPVYDLVVAEPECAYFFFGEDVQEPGAFRWTEGWTKDVTWFMTNQMQKEYYKEYLRITEALFIKDRIAEMYKPVEEYGHIRM